MKYSITLTPGECEEIIFILIEKETQAEREAADPDLECIKQYSEREAARARELREILLARRQLVEEDEKA